MNTSIDYVLILFSGFLLCFLPGIIFARKIIGLNKLSVFTCAIFISVAFWISAAWILSLLNLPLNYSVISLLILFAVWLFVKKVPDFLKQISISKIFSLVKDIPLHYFILLIFLCLYSYQFFLVSIVPGSDTAMHGYITRLIINNNSLPQSYEPILPYDNFGNYSAGFHVFTALVSYVNEAFLRIALNFTSILVYPITLLSIVFFLNNFYSVKTSIYSGVIAFSAANILQGTIGWGGTPSMFAFAFSVFSASLMYFSVKNNQLLPMYLCAFTIACIALTHAVIAYAFFYLILVGFIFVCFYFKEKIVWVVRSMAVLFLLSMLLLLPFFLNFHYYEQNTLLSQMIWDWQQVMFGNANTGNIFHSVGITIKEIVRRIGDVYVILSSLAFFALLIKGKYQVIAITSFFILIIFLLVLNSCCWILPLSELLYPERVLFFMILAFSFFVASFFDLIEGTRLFKTGKLKPVSVSGLVIIIFLVLGLRNSHVRYTSALFNKNNMVYDKYIHEAFNWIENNTEPDAVLNATYPDIGIWIPAFTNRATIGTHINWTHVIENSVGKLKAKEAVNYYFITQKDKAEQTKIVNDVKGKNLVFKNDKFSIYCSLNNE